MCCETSDKKENQCLGVLPAVRGSIKSVRVYEHHFPKCAQD